MQVDWVCLLLCLMPISCARWVFPEQNGPAAPALITYADSSSSSSINRDSLRQRESIISLTSVYDPIDELDIDGFPKAAARQDSFSVSPGGIRHVRYGIKVPPPNRRDDTVDRYGLKVQPPPPIPNSIPIPQLPQVPPSPPTQLVPRPQPLVLASGSFTRTDRDDFIGQPTKSGSNRVVRQYRPPLITSETFSPSVSFDSDEAFLPSTYFIQTEVSPIYYPSGSTNKKSTLSQYKYQTHTTTFTPVNYKATLSPKRHTSYDSYKAPQPYNHVISQKYDSAAPIRYESPDPYKYNNPEPYKYDTPEPYKYNTPAPYKYNTPEPYKHNTPAPYKYNTPEPYKHNTPEPYNKYKAPITYKAPEPQKYSAPKHYSYVTPTPYEYNTPPPHKYNTPKPYKHKTPAPYKYHPPPPQKSYASSSYDVPKLENTEHKYKHHKAQKYDYRYNVGSVYHGTAYRHQEKSDGETVRGEYRVRLPDGRLQVVTYTADHENGYVPEVRYEGPQTLEAANIHFQPPTPTKI